MMRKLFVFTIMAGLMAMGGFVRDARAGATVDLLFVGKNGGAIAATNTVTATPSDVLTMAAFMRNDQTLTVAIFSLNYDLDGDNELDAIQVFQWGGVAIAKATDNFLPVGPLSPTTATFAGSFQGATTNFGGPRTLPVAGGAFAGGYQMGTVVWHANGGTGNDGADIISGILNFGVDVFGDGAFNDISNLVQFNSATVNFVPEPGTASLLGLGLVGLLLVGRRSRRS